MIVMDYVSGGTLKQFIENAASNLTHPRFRTTLVYLKLRKSHESFTHACSRCVTPWNRIKIFEGCAFALSYLHAMDPAPILHRDIKSDNILLEKDFTPILADLGEARVKNNCTMTTVGTKGYTAPEV